MKRINHKILYEGKWLILEETAFETKDGSVIRWERVSRRNQPNAVAIVAQLIPSKRLVIIKQFRPAIDGYILGFPAGLIDEGEGQILKELKEETGYTGTIIEMSPPIKASPGLMDDTAFVVYAQVDENDPANQNPTQTLEPEEDIEVFLVEPHRLKEFLLTEHARGTHIGGGLWYLASISKLIL